MTSINRKVVVLIFFLGYMMLGCKTERGIKKPDLRKHIIEENQVFLSVEHASFLARPISLESVSDGLLIVDVGSMQITKVDYSGNHILSFGKQGRGPGEFQTISGFWQFENEYLIYDYNTFRFSIFDYSGNLIDEQVLSENPVYPSSKKSIPITLHALSPDTLIIPTGGRKGSLFAIVDKITGNVSYAGIPVREFEEYNNSEVMEAYSRGEIPNIMSNLILLGSSSSAIYLFKQTTGVLEKYTHEGEFVWKKEVVIPAQEKLFDEISQYNSRMKIGDIRKIFMYAKAIDVHESGVALLLNVPEGYPLTILWVPEEGDTIDVIKVKGIELDLNGFEEGFTISPDGQHAYYLKRSKGIIYQFEWPL